MKRKFAVGSILAFLILSLLVNAFAHNNDKHYREIESVLFGTKKFIIMYDNERKKLVQYMEYATAIALDQYRGEKGVLLEALKRYGVPGLPDNVTDIGTETSINFAGSPNNHRQFTHKGWTYIYPERYKDANWPKRRQIITETVRKVLNTSDDEVCDSFAAILYYVHLLGDMQEDSSRTERDQVIPLIEKHGLGDVLSYRPNKDIFIELYHYLSVLFEGRIDKTYKSIYTRMMRKIKDIYSEAKRDMRSNDAETKKANDNNLTPEQLDDYSHQLLDALKKDLPELLKQTIFKEVFYNNGETQVQ